MLSSGLRFIFHGVKYNSLAVSSFASQNHYYFMDLKPGCNREDAKAQFLQKAKMFHPDSGHKEANEKKFHELTSCYTKILKDIKKETNIDFDMEIEIEDIEKNLYESMPIGSRQYLSFGGFGYGSPSQRQKQFQQFRADRAHSQLIDYKINKLQETSDEKGLVVAKRMAKKKKTSQFIERVVEDSVLESIARGEMDDLEGKGKPINYSKRNPHIDTEDHYMNQILVNSGFGPDWVMLRKDVLTGFEDAKKALFNKRKKLYLNVELSPNDPKSAEEYEQEFYEDMTELNKKILDYNLIVPILNMHMRLYDIPKELVAVRKNFTTFVSENKDDLDKERVKRQEKMKNYRQQTFNIFDVISRGVEPK